MTPSTPSEEALSESAVEPAPQRAPARSASPTTSEARSTNLEAVFTATHDVLFAPDEPRCDVCNEPVGRLVDGAGGEADDDDGGHGLYIWVRNGEVIYEEPPLCGACAAAITISAMQRWDIEEEDG